MKQTSRRTFIQKSIVSVPAYLLFDSAWAKAESSNSEDVMDEALVMLAQTD